MVEVVSNKQNHDVERDYGTNCRDCERFKRVGEVCVIEHGKRFLWEYCRDFEARVELPDYNELMKTVRQEHAALRQKEREKKEREKKLKLKERQTKKEQKRRERIARSRRKYYAKLKKKKAASEKRKKKREERKKEKLKQAEMEKAEGSPDSRKTLETIALSEEAFSLSSRSIESGKRKPTEKAVKRRESPIPSENKVSDKKTKKSNRPPTSLLVPSYGTEGPSKQGSLAESGNVSPRPAGNSSLPPTESVEPKEERTVIRRKERIRSSDHSSKTPKTASSARATA